MGSGWGRVMVPDHFKVWAQVITLPPSSPNPNPNPNPRDAEKKLATRDVELRQARSEIADLTKNAAPGSVNDLTEQAKKLQKEVPLTLNP